MSARAAATTPSCRSPSHLRPPPDDGCGPSLTWWFSPDSVAKLEKQEKRKQAEAETGPKLPDACADLLAPDIATR